MDPIQEVIAETRRISSLEKGSWGELISSVDAYWIGGEQPFKLGPGTQFVFKGKKRSILGIGSPEYVIATNIGTFRVPDITVNPLR